MRFAVKKINPGRQRRIVSIVKGKPRPPPESAYYTTKKAIDVLYENDRSFENSAYEIYRKTVMIKPNLIMPKVEAGSSNMTNTDPEACRAVVDWLMEKEAKRIIIADSQVWDDVDPWESCGYRDVFSSKPYREVVEFMDLSGDDEELVEIDYEMAKDFYTEEDLAFLKGFLEGHMTEKKMPMAQFFQDATSTSSTFGESLKEARVLINMSKLTTHVQTGVSLSVKNHFSLLQPAVLRSAKHLGMDPFQRDLSYNEMMLSSMNVQRAIACVAAAYKRLRIPQLSLVEGIICQEGNGPLDVGKPRQEDLVAVSWNCPATLDAVLAERFISLKVDGKSYLPPHIQWASRVGLGTRDISEVSLILAREDGIPASSIKEMRNDPDHDFEPPASLSSGCIQRVYPRDTLLPVVTRTRDYLEEKGIDPNEKVHIMDSKIHGPEGLVVC